MNHAIAIGMLGLGNASNRAAAQVAVEHRAIRRDVQLGAVAYTEQHKCLALFPEALTATPAQTNFTLPMAVGFR